jgi:hypothetical protein
MKKTLYIAAALFVFSFSSCQKEFSITDAHIQNNFNADAQTFIDNSGITDNTQQLAINNLVIQLKAGSLWGKFIAIYPMVGGTAATTKWNLKDPRDLDEAYRLTFTGNPVYANTGVLFPTIDDYADTHLEDNAIGGSTNASLSYYSRTQNTISGYDMGCTDGAVPFNELSIYSDASDNSEWFGFSQHLFSPNTTGLFMLSSSSTNVTRTRNGVVVSSKGSAPNPVYTNLTILLGKSRVTVHPGKKECAFATIGNGLTDAEAMTFYNIVQNFQTALGR